MEQNLVNYGNIFFHAFNYMKNLKFQETKVILSGRLYSEFIKDFKENLKEIFIVPIIIVFTRNKDNFIKYNKEYLNNENIIRINF